MNLTDTQLDAIKAWIVANVPDATEFTAQAALNALASPAYKVYRKFVPMQEVMGNNFDWTRVDNLNVGKARIWEWMERAYASGDVGGLNFVNPSCRAGINAIWVGTQADLDVRAAVYSHATRDASQFEKLLKVAGNGTAPDASGNGPATMAFEGPISVDDVIRAMNRP